MTRSAVVRILRYNAVGAMGLALKFSVLAGLVELAGCRYMLATAVAFEVAALNNFWWHLRWTWRDRSTGWSRNETLERLLKFHMGVGGVALVTNLVLMRVLVETAGLHYLIASILATVLAGTANFIVSNFVVFASAARPASCRM